MNTFLLDLWHDLKQKRLWPVAVVLIVATAAVPVLLSQPAEEGSEPVTPPIGETAQNPLPAVDAETVPASSNLEVFDSHNPFSPNKDVPRDLGGDDSSSSSSGSGGGSGKFPTGSSGGDGSSAASDAGGSGGSGSSPGDSSGGGSGGGTFWFTFQINVKFGPVGEVKTKKGLKALDVLPNEENPVVVFMGMKDDGATALFMVLDPGIEASGEGNCTPSPDRCSFVELTTSAKQDEVFLNSSRGEDYFLQLSKIERVKIDEPAKSSKANESRSARRQKSDPQPFFLPSILSRAVGE
jgi:hypothetical protein